MKFILLLTLVFIIYGVKFSFLPMDFQRISYLVIVPLAFVLLLFGRRRYSEVYLLSVNKEWKFLFLLFLVSFLYTILVLLYSGSMDLTFLRMHIDYFLTFFILIPTLYLLFFESMSKNEGFNVLIRLLILVGLIQAIVMISMLILPNFQKFVFGFIDTNGAHIRFESDFRYRAIGLTGFASYSMAVSQCFILYLFVYLWTNNQSAKEFIISLFSFFIILASALLSARTSFIFILPLYTLIGTAALIRFRPKLSKKLFYVLFATVLLSSVAFVYFSVIESALYRRLYSWMFELFLNLIESGSFSTQSTDSLSSLFFIPSMSTIFWGDGKYLLNGAYYMETDVGFLRVLLYGGVVGSFLFYAPFFYLFYLGFKTTKIQFGFFVALLFLIFSLAFFVINIKGSIFFDGFNTLKLVGIFVFVSSMLSKRSVSSCNNY